MQLNQLEQPVDVLFDLIIEDIQSIATAFNIGLGMQYAHIHARIEQLVLQRGLDPEAVGYCDLLLRQKLGV